jgi:hypothetical protein
MNRQTFKQDPLKAVLNLAYQQAMLGKGMERHGENKPFDEQIWAKITHACGLGFPVGQAMKKNEEATRMPKDAAVRELLGGINYLAMAVIALIEGESNEQK